MAAGLKAKHGPAWKAWAETFGAEPSASADVAWLGVRPVQRHPRKPRARWVYLYQCGQCEKTYQVTARCHNQATKGNAWLYCSRPYCNNAFLAYRHTRVNLTDGTVQENLP